MKISENGIKLLEFSEGKKLFKYLDTKGIPTIGIGHALTHDELSSGVILINGISVKFIKGLTEEQVEDLCTQDLQIASACVEKSVKVDLNQNQFDVLVEFTFNIGTGAFSKSTLLKILNQKDYAGVPEQVRRWVHGNNKEVIPGLVARREREVELWNK